MYRHRHLDLFALGKAAEIGMDHPASKRIDLAILKNNVIHAFAINIQ